MKKKKRPQVRGPVATRATKSSKTSEDIRRWILDRLAAELDRSPETIDAKEDLRHYGLDSMLAVSIVGDLGEWLGQELSATLLWELTTIDAIVDHLATPRRKKTKAQHQARSAAKKKLGRRAKTR